MYDDLHRGKNKSEETLLVLKQTLCYYNYSFGFSESFDSIGVVQISKLIHEGKWITLNQPRKLWFDRDSKTLIKHWKD